MHLYQPRSLLYEKPRAVGQLLSTLYNLRTLNSFKHCGPCLTSTTLNLTTHKLTLFFYDSTNHMQLQSSENSILPLSQLAKRHKNKVEALFTILLLKEHNESSKSVITLLHCKIKAILNALTCL